MTRPVLPERPRLVLEPPPRRRAGPWSMVAIDLLRHAGLTRRWISLLIVAIALLAAMAAFLAQAAAPWAIYPAL